MKNPKKFWQILIPIAVILWSGLSLSAFLSSFPLMVSATSVDLAKGLSLFDELRMSPSIFITIVSLTEFIFAIVLIFKKSSSLLNWMAGVLILDILVWMWNFGYFSGILTKEMFTLNQFIAVCLPQIILLVLIFIGKKQYVKNV